MLGCVEPETDRAGGEQSRGWGPRALGFLCVPFEGREKIGGGVGEWRGVEEFGDGPTKGHEGGRRQGSEKRKWGRRRRGTEWGTDAWVWCRGRAAGDELNSESYFFFGVWGLGSMGAPGGKSFLGDAWRTSGGVLQDERKFGEGHTKTCVWRTREWGRRADGLRKFFFWNEVWGVGSGREGVWDRRANGLGIGQNRGAQGGCALGAGKAEEEGVGAKDRQGFFLGGSGERKEKGTGREEWGSGTSVVFSLVLVLLGVRSRGRRRARAGVWGSGLVRFIYFIFINYINSMFSTND